MPFRESYNLLFARILREMIPVYVLGRGDAEFLLEADTEILRIIEANLVCNFGNGGFFLLDYFAGLFQSDVSDKIGWRHPGKHLDFPVQGGFGDIHVIEKHVE